MMHGELYEEVECGTVNVLKGCGSWVVYCLRVFADVHADLINFVLQSSVESGDAV